MVNKLYKQRLTIE